MKYLCDYQDCKEYEKVVSKATATENGLTFELINESGVEIAKWRIDDCVLKEADGSKCDYLIVVNKRSTCYWIELKDQDLDAACLQIESTIKKIADSKDYQNHVAIIVLGRFNENRNRVDNLRYTNFKKLANKVGGKEKIKFRTKMLTEII